MSCEVRSAKHGSRRASLLAQRRVAPYVHASAGVASSRWQQSCGVGAMMKRPRTTVISLVAAALSLAWPVDGQNAGPPRARSVVLVHGAWADGSSWSAVIPILQAAGLHVAAVQNPLSSLADSVAATRRALAVQDGPTV